MLIDKKLRKTIKSSFLSNSYEELDISIIDFHIPSILFSKNDPTSLFFIYYCKKMNYKINSFQIESILHDSNSLENFSLIVSKLKSVYLRPPILTDLIKISYWVILHAKLTFNVKNIIQPSIHFLNYSKPLQMLKSIIPNQNNLVKPINSLILNNKHIIQNKKTFIVKGISDYRTIVVELNDKRLNKSADNNITHFYQIQEKLDGLNVRIHIINDKAFGVIMSKSETIDYRYSKEKIEIKLIKIPIEVKEFCLKVTESEKLIFSGIDFIISNGYWYCLEINPNPGYHSYDINNFEISKEIYNYLMK